MIRFLYLLGVLALSVPIALAAEEPTAVFLDKAPGIQNGAATYDPESRSCGAGEHVVFTELVDAVAALERADVLYIRAGNYSRTVAPSSQVHGSDVNYWEGALAIQTPGEPNRRKRISAYQDEEVVIQAKPDVSRYNADPNDHSFKNSSHFYPNPAISVGAPYVDIHGLKTFGQVLIASHDVTLQRCDIGGGGPHMNQGQALVLNSNRAGGVYDVVIRNNRIHHSTWGESTGNGASLMCYNASFLAEHNEFYDGFGSDICIKDTGMQEGRTIEIRYNFFGPSAIGPGGGSGVQGHNQDAKVDKILVHHNLFLNKGAGFSFRGPARLGTFVYSNTFVNCGRKGGGGDVTDWQNPEIRLWNNLFYHSRPNHVFYDVQTDPWEKMQSNWNLFYSTVGDTAWRHKYRPRARTLADWQVYSGKDENSVWKNPEFIRPNGDRPVNFRRKGGSPANDVAGSQYGEVCGAYVSGEEVIGVKPE